MTTPVVRYFTKAAAAAEAAEAEAGRPVAGLQVMSRGLQLQCPYGGSLLNPCGESLWRIPTAAAG